ncbi:hypothetical protein CRG98_046654 [Punica granatum]|uniref:Uncharacterized protein n=1 Tax=Punica granatum TaxID=22663 RepID=A0A2I0HML4_PUNGR|nr:hypothetical protein CRG98_046654 [Punica granatum]
MDFPWFDQVDSGSSSRSKKHNHQNLPPKKRFCIKSSLTAWRPDHRQQLILDDLWVSIKNPQKGEESMNALVLHMEEQGNKQSILAAGILPENRFAATRAIPPKSSYSSFPPRKVS